MFDTFAHLHGELKSRNHQLNQSIKKIHERIDWLIHKPIGHPLKSGINISSGFGVRIDPIRGTSSDHLGVDFQVPVGTMIYSSGAGIVQKAGWDESYGLSLVVAHGDGYAARYAHASELLVSEGAAVGRFEPIAKVGSTGRSTGPHLHFEILKNGRALNPKEWLIGLREN